MLNYKILPAAACFILLFSASCKRQKITKTPLQEKDTTQIVKTDSAPSPVVAPPKTTDNKPVEQAKIAPKVLVKIDDINFNYLNLKSRLNFRDANTDQSATATFHIKKDSAIWFSVNVILVEGARGVITKDSIHFFALDSKTFKRNYYDLSVDSLSRQFNFKLDFGLLQSLLIGNMPIKKRDIDSVSLVESNFLIHQIEPTASGVQLLIDNFIASDNNKLKKLVAAPSSGNGKMTITYDNFLTINNSQDAPRIFPQTDSVEILSQKDGQPTQTNVNLQHTKVEFTNENPGFVFKKK